MVFSRFVMRVMSWSSPYMKEPPKDMTALPIDLNRFEKKILLLKIQLKDLDFPGLDYLQCTSGAVSLMRKIILWFFRFSIFLDPFPLPVTLSV